ncbi:urate oxidase [Wenjunlia vitaminophila]|uniref:Uricase n=1 Tax=Wenjunlia vitaminophila TaxID=76728 RepID=A0A0T6LZ27_WENVI|nr:urate oxidase [Wenjunlia vitaminophila]KRV51322.1 urate oxidase [Wenjunlia vitaminophila]
MATVLGPAGHGKAETRVVRVTRDGATHHLKDLNVSIALAGDLEQTYLTGDNTGVLPTDTMKNTVYAFAKEHGIPSAEAFALRLARHFVTSQPSVRRASVRVEEYAWERITADSRSAARGGAGHSFVRQGRQVRVCRVTDDGQRYQVLSGLSGLTVLNSTDSEFRGYPRDRYTTLAEASDRVLATEVNALWRYGWTGEGDGPEPAWDAVHARATQDLLEAFAETYSHSLQQTLYRMGAQVIENNPSVDEVRLSLPNKHHFLVDLEPFGLKNDNEVYFAADRPYGLIEGTVLREGAEAGIPEE